MALPTSELPDIAVVADSCFIASHRLTEWVSNAPSMEEDVAMGNIALDLLGQARGLYAVLGDEDQLAYFRDADEWRNLVLCELPNGDFAHTMLRLLFVSEWLALAWPQLLDQPDEHVRGVAEKAIKENAYHRRHARNWVVRLGDGTEESHRRCIVAIEELAPYLGDVSDQPWLDSINAVLSMAAVGPLRSLAEVSSGASANASSPPGTSTRELRGPSAAIASIGSHSPHLVELLSEMQSLARAHPGAAW